MLSDAVALMKTADHVRVETLSRLRVKVAQIDRLRTGGRALTNDQLAVLDEVLSLIDEEMRHA